MTAVASTLAFAAELSRSFVPSPRHAAQALRTVAFCMQAIPDIRQRAELELVGTPLTHARYLRRYKGSYGPAISAARGSFPRATTPIPGLLGCGDSYAPGIGVPAAAASGLIAANSLVPLPSHLKLLREMEV